MLVTLNVLRFGSCFPLPPAFIDQPFALAELPFSTAGRLWQSESVLVKGIELPMTYVLTLLLPLEARVPSGRDVPVVMAAVVQGLVGILVSVLW